MEETLKKSIFDLLDKEPYKTNINIEDNPLIEIFSKIRDTIDNPFFEPIDKYVPSMYAKDIIHLLYDYYSNIYINDNGQNKLENNKERSKEIPKDIKTIQSFLDLLSKNAIYQNQIERNYQNKQDDKFVFDYCKNLIDDLETKRFEKSQKYKITQFKVSKNSIKDFFSKLTNKYPSLKKHDDIKQFIDSI